MTHENFRYLGFLLLKLKEKMGNEENVFILKYFNVGAMSDIALNINKPTP